ncbi:hypothetical protein MNBD_GAMMA02-279, partial [hydrothermal vent metagenome]
MQLNQDFMILNRKGQSMLSQISGAVQSLVIHEPDVLLLSYFLPDNNLESATNDFVEDTWVKAWLPHIQSEGVKQRIQQFKEAGLFDPSQAPNDGLTLLPLDSLPADDKSTLPEQLSLSRHAAISLHAKGFFACSNLDQTPRLLPTEYVVLMLAFGDGIPIQKVVAEKRFLFNQDVEQVLKILFKHGYLVERKNTGKKTPETQPQYATVQADSGLKSWREIEPDDKIPVYFVPHMENHFPLALGI